MVERGSLVSLSFHTLFTTPPSPNKSTSRWFLFPPSQAFLSAIPISNWLQGEYTLLEERPFECYQNPGDIVFVPESWGHGGQLSLALPFPPPQPVGFPHNLFVLSSVVNIHDTIAVSMELMRYYSIWGLLSVVYFIYLPCYTKDKKHDTQINK